MDIGKAIGVDPDMKGHTLDRVDEAVLGDVIRQLLRSSGVAETHSTYIVVL